MDTTQTTQQLDPEAVNLTKAIRQTETGGNFTAMGKSGEFGAYQFTEPTWNATAPKYGVNVSLQQATPEQQNEVAYKQIKEWKDKGHNVGEIASMWNAGEKNPNAYMENNVGVNKYGVRFNTPAYAKSVATAYQTLKSGGQVGIDPNNPSSTAGTQTAPQPQSNPSGATFQAGDNTGNTGNPILDVGQGVATDIGKMAGNIPSSAFNLGKNLLGAVMHPIKTVENIGGAAVGGVEKGLGAITGKNVDDAQTQKFDSVMGALKDKYGSIENLRKYAIEDPVSLALDIATVTEGGGAALKGASLAGQSGDIAELTAGMSNAEKASFISDLSKEGALGTGAQIGQEAINTGRAINPISLAAKGVGKVAGFAGNAAKYILGQEGGVQSSTIGATIGNPGEFTSEAIAGANDSRTELGNTIVQGLNDKLDALNETGSQYGDIRKLNTSINVDPNFLMQQIQQNTGLDFNDATGRFEFSTTGKVSSSADINKINSFFQNWQPSFDNGTMTPDEYLNMRQQLQKISFNESGIGKSGDLENAANGIRKSLNSTYREQVPGLTEKDVQFSAQADEWQKLKDKLFNKDNTPKANITTTVATATGKGKTAMLAQLEEISPGITEKIGIQKALEDWQAAGDGIKVGTYGKAASIVGGIATGAAGGGAVGAVIGGMAATLLTSPQILVPMLRAVGASSDLISSIMSKVSSAMPLNTTELTAFANALSKANTQKNPPISAFQSP